MYEAFIITYAVYWFFFLSRDITDVIQSGYSIFSK